MQPTKPATVGLIFFSGIRFVERRRRAEDFWLSGVVLTIKDNLDACRLDALQPMSSVSSSVKNRKYNQSVRLQDIENSIRKLTNGNELAFTFVKGTAEGIGAPEDQSQ